MKHPNRTVRPCALAGLACLAGLVAACTTPNLSGDYSAHLTGDLPDTPAPRLDPLTPFLESCGEAGRTAEGRETLARAPYVQQTDAHSTHVLWTAQTEAPMAVEVTLPDGARVAHVDARADPADDEGPIRQYVARIDGLEPDTLYCYRVLAGDVPLVERTGFATAPGPDAHVEFAAFGDSGHGGGDQEAVYAQLRSVPLDLAVITGDVAYPSGTLAQLEAHYFDVYEDLVASVPMFPTTGNHDYRTRSAQPFRDVFSLPDNGVEGASERWYSFDWGPVHFVALDTERVGPAQAAWLEEDLAADDHPWTVVYTHEPPYSSGYHGSNHEVREWLAPILERHGVDLVLAGHDHHYERTVPIGGVVYVVTGGGGRGTRPTGESDFTAFAEGVLHFLYVSADPDTLTLHAIDATGREFDSVTLTR
ncbi:MAG: metallophosphoesterase [Myxococcota bacterium]